MGGEEGGSKASRPWSSWTWKPKAAWRDQVEQFCAWSERQALGLEEVFDSFGIEISVKISMNTFIEAYIICQSNHWCKNFNTKWKIQQISRKVTQVRKKLWQSGFSRPSPGKVALVEFLRASLVWHAFSLLPPLLASEPQTYSSAAKVTPVQEFLYFSKIRLFFFQIRKNSRFHGSGGVLYELMSILYIHFNMYICILARPYGQKLGRPDPLTCRRLRP